MIRKYNGAQHDLTIFWIILAISCIVIIGLLMAGCGGGQAQYQQVAPNVKANIHGPIRALAVRNPVVIFFGDSVTCNWITPSVIAQHPMWVNAGTTGCAPGETTTQLLARFQADVIAKKPDVVHIIAGTYDIVAPNWDFSPACGPGEEACLNVSSMITQAQSANIKVILGSIPPFGAGPLATVYSPSEAQQEQYFWNLSILYANYGQSQLPPVAAEVDYSTALGQDTEAPVAPPGPLYQVAYTDDGINPNAAGGEVMTGLAVTAISALNVGELGLR